ncbi:MAG: hypothetical protein JSU68_14050 [Phycisphaerales bacterium]|nr:MAG: hypothetical protein JSU68_14050 [Phycisphaerales bacterium]
MTNVMQREWTARGTGSGGRKWMMVLGLVVVMLTGCAQPVGVRRTSDEAWFQRMQRNALNSNSPSHTTGQYLRQRDLDGTQVWHPEDVLEELVTEFYVSPSRNCAAVLAELCYLRAKKEDIWKPEEAAKLYTTSMLFACAYLFDEELGAAPSAYDPRFRLACDLYNRSLAKLVLRVTESGGRWGDEIRLESLIGPVQLAYGVRELHWAPGEYHEAHTVYEYEVEGLSNQFRTAGLGVPGILLRKPPPEGEGTVYDRFLPNQMDQTYPVTVVLQTEGSIRSRLAEGETHRTMVNLYDPMKTNVIEIGGRQVELETDITTPLAYWLDKAPKLRGIEGFLDVEAWDRQRGLYMFEPYQPEKIPVVFVHGLVSRPMTWLLMVNDLLGDRELRERYQIWWFLYPTGNPVIYSARTLRNSLLEVQHTFDPDGNDPAFQQMVLVGHSMGGLLSRTMVQSSGDRLWSAITDVPVDDLDISDREKQFLREIFFYEPLPFVKRVVFIATPHRGSTLADLWIARQAASKVKLPIELVDAAEEVKAALLKADPSLEGKLRKRVSTSIEGLSPESREGRIMAEIPIAPWVTYHSIIANSKAADTPGGTDTVVPYESSHLNGAASERIVKGTHTCTGHPLVILEVKRILMEHLGDGAGVE